MAFCIIFMLLYPVLSLGTRIVPQTFEAIKKEQKAGAKRTAEEISACIKMFKLNEININDLYEDFIMSGSSSIWDFYEYIYDVAGDLSTRSSLASNLQKVQFYHVIQIRGDKASLETAAAYKSKATLSQYCKINKLEVRHKRMTLDSVLNVLPSSNLGQFSKIYSSDDAYWLYYIVDTIDLPADYFARYNYSHYKFRRDTTLASQRLMF